MIRTATREGARQDTHPSSDLLCSLLFVLVGADHHGNNTLDRVIVAVCMGQEATHTLLCPSELVPTNKPPWRFRSQSHQDEDWDGPNPLDGEWSLVSADANAARHTLYAHLSLRPSSPITTPAPTSWPVSQQRLVNLDGELCSVHLGLTRAGGHGG